MPASKPNNNEDPAAVSDRDGRATTALFIIVSTFLVLLTNVPLLYGYLSQPPNLKFMGIVAGVRDSNFYFMMMNQGDGWSPILHNYFATGEPDTIYHGFFWFLLGKIAGILGLENLTAYHAARIAVTILFVPAAYWFVSRFLESKSERVTALIMLCFSAGGGWAPMLLYQKVGVPPFIPSDVGTPEASSFFTLMTFPHLSVALLLIAMCFALVEGSISRQRMSWAVAAGMCGMVLGFIHAINLVVIYAALALFAVASLIILKETRPFRFVIVFGALSVWPIAYYLFLTLTRPELLPQAPVRSPIPVAYLVGFAPQILLSSIHVADLVRRRSLPRGDLFLICWAIANCLLLYSYPLLSQEARAVLGLQLPLTVLSVRAIFATITPWIEPEWGKANHAPKRVAALLVIVLIVVFTFPGSFYNISERVRRLQSYPDLFSLTYDEYEALQFLRDASGEGIVLSGEWTGGYVPRLTRKHSWLGQYDLPSRDSRFEAAKDFFSGAMSLSRRYAFLTKNNVGFVYYGRQERALGGKGHTGTTFLKPVFGNDSVDIYRFEPDHFSDKE